MNEQFIKLANTSVSYNQELKDKFHKQGKAILRKLAKEIGLIAPGSYDIRSNMGGIAVSGEVTLHSDHLYIQFSQSCLGASHGFMWRECEGRKDYCGKTNQFMAWEKLANLSEVCDIIERQIPHVREPLNPLWTPVVMRV